jgi:Holliday junction DNA helicase RuvA
VVLDRTPPSTLLVEVGGVGYRVTVPVPVLGAADLGGPIFLHVHTHVREDAIVLYGFSTRDERGCFEALIAAHGVGPGLALAILSVHSPAGLRRVVATDDLDALVLVPGVGKKTAARLLIELKSALAPGDDDSFVVLVDGAGPSAQSEVRAALAGLGYGVDEVREAVRDLPDEGTVEDLLKAALQQLAVSR